jgi:hypothetical protein
MKAMDNIKINKIPTMGKLSIIIDSIDLKNSSKINMEGMSYMVELSIRINSTLHPP